MSLDSEYRKVDSRAVTHFRTFEPLVISPSNNKFTPSQELNIRQTSIAGDVFYNWNDSYLELKVKTQFYTDSNCTNLVESTIESVVVSTLGQPACLVDRITGDAKFINADGTESAIDLTNNTLNIGMYRSLINLIYQPRSFHSKNAYLTEFPYDGIAGYRIADPSEYSDELVPKWEGPFRNYLTFYRDKSSGEYIATIRVPWSSLLDLGMQTYLCNMKSINLKLSWIPEERWFGKVIASTTRDENKKIVINKDSPFDYKSHSIEISSARTVTDYYRVTDKNNLQFPEELLTLPEINPIGNYEHIPAGTERWHHSYRLPYAPSACFIFFTDDKNSYYSITNLDIEYLRVYTGSGWSNALPHYDNDASSIDSRYYDTLASMMNNDEEHIINFDNYLYTNRIYAVDFTSDAELLQSQNEIFFELRFDKEKVTENLNIHVVFIENPPTPVIGKISIE